jgi:hypothetical protein
LNVRNRFRLVAADTCASAAKAAGLGPLQAVVSASANRARATPITRTVYQTRYHEQIVYGVIRGRTQQGRDVTAWRTHLDSGVTAWILVCFIPLPAIRLPPNTAAHSMMRLGIKGPGSGEET